MISAITDGGVKLDDHAKPIKGYQPKKVQNINDDTLLQTDAAYLTQSCQQSS